MQGQWHTYHNTTQIIIKILFFSENLRSCQLISDLQEINKCHNRQVPKQNAPPRKSATAFRVCECCSIQVSSPASIR